MLIIADLRPEPRQAEAGRGLYRGMLTPENFRAFRSHRAALTDDPPLERPVRRSRLGNWPEMCQWLLDMYPSAKALSEF